MSGVRCPVLPPCGRHGEAACGGCYDLPAEGSDVDAVLSVLSSGEARGIVPAGEAMLAWMRWRFWPPRVFTLRCVMGEMAARSAEARALVARFQARLDGAGGVEAVHG